MILNADIMYGEGNELKNKVFMGWAEELLETVFQFAPKSACFGGPAGYWLL